MGSIVSIVLAAVVAMALFTFFMSTRTPKRAVSIPAVAGIGAVIAVIAAAIACFTQVGPSTIGVVTTWGHIDSDTLAEGPHLVSPVSKVHEVFVGLDVARITGAQAASKDLQSVHTDLTMNYRVDPARVLALYRNAPTLDYEVNYVQPAMFEVFKSVVARYTAEELVTKRQLVSEGILAGLRTKLQGYGLLIQDINMTNFKFSQAFDAAIEAKVTASQRAEQAERELARVKFEAEQQVEKARGEAESIAIQAQAVKTNGGEQYLRLQAINKWNGVLPTYMGAGAPVPFLNVQQQ
ncbi:bacteriophage/transposase fusion protein [Caballeronia arvi]|uniref:Bacteriophage/transposase fusion protein n=1 Tax=Caballeronia arvi TaxID=1777135 RepID=A0A158JCW1_9BURK|nr:prohibitin family protein [Caballeronia arvi]SAL66694.1 bacteriophage/transposase fusion protein [Caballeronia arvi]